jgi:anti-sigma28 factor (negative regulator of flagellin synthesis)
MVDSLKQAVNSGQYELNPGKIAASMVDDHA